MYACSQCTRNFFVMLERRYTLDGVPAGGRWQQQLQRRRRSTRGGAWIYHRRPTRISSSRHRAAVQGDDLVLYRLGQATWCEIHRVLSVPCLRRMLYLSAKAELLHFKLHTPARG